MSHASLLVRSGGDPPSLVYIPPSVWRLLSPERVAGLDHERIRPIRGVWLHSENNSLFLQHPATLGWGYVVSRTWWESAVCRPDPRRRSTRSRLAAAWTYLPLSPDGLRPFRECVHLALPPVRGVGHAVLMPADAGVQMVLLGRQPSLVTVKETLDWLGQRALVAQQWDGDRDVSAAAERFQYVALPAHDPWLWPSILTGLVWPVAAANRAADHYAAPWSSRRFRWLARWFRFGHLSGSVLEYARHDPGMRRVLSRVLADGPRPWDTASWRGSSNMATRLLFHLYPEH